MLHTVAVDSDEGPGQLMEWTDGVVRPVLAFAKTHLRLHEGTTLRFVASGPDRGRRVANIVPQLNVRTNVDNVIARDDYAQQALVEENNTVAPALLSSTNLFGFGVNYSIGSVAGSVHFRHNIDDI